MYNYKIQTKILVKIMRIKRKNTLKINSIGQFSIIYVDYYVAFDF